MGKCVFDHDPCDCKLGTPCGRYRPNGSRRDDMPLEDAAELAWWRHLRIKFVPGDFPLRVGQPLLGRRFRLVDVTREILRSDWPTVPGEHGEPIPVPTLTDPHHHTLTFNQTEQSYACVCGYEIRAPDERRWKCEECHTLWTPTPDRPNQCHRCGNPTRIPV